MRAISLNHRSSLILKRYPYFGAALMDRLISSNSSPGFKHFSTSNTALDLCRSGPSMSSPNGPLTTDRPNYLEQALPQATRDLHDRSVLEGASTYTDPDSGYTVFCRKAHLDRGKCCGSGCRHCPYGWENVPAHRKPRPPTKLSDYSEAKVTVPPVADVEDIAKCSTDVATEAPATTESTPVAGEGRPVKKSRVYTRTGDKGKSSLYTGERRPKTDVVFETLGTVDELMSCIGVAKEYLRLQQQATPSCSEETNNTATMDSITTSQVNQIVSVEALEHIQQLLMDVATIVATPVGGEKVLNRERAREKLSMYNPDEWIKDLERQIDLADSYLPPITVFILPGGGLASAHLHVARSTCRRAERCMIWVQQEYGDDYDPLLTSACKFVNRLSDFLFVAARAVALHADIHRSTPNGGK
eukprot:GILI01023291.1.p1 GENE.GILI01023291.1~~GILI01023291.1.p1  ORF type:complete len:422 (-),score=39.80 GILI01023291.1:82-1326(-)